MTGLNPVQLQVENINLRHRLEEAEARIEEMQLSISQGAVHVYHENPLAPIPGQAGPNQNQLNALRNNTTPERLQSEIQRLRSKLNECEEKATRSEARAAALEGQLAAKNASCTCGGGGGGGAAASGANDVDGAFSSWPVSQESSWNDGPPSEPPSPPKTAPRSEALIALTNEKETLEREVARLRQQLGNTNADVFKWRSSHGSAVQEANTLKAELQRVKQQLHDASQNNNQAAAAGATAQQLDEANSRNDELREQLEMTQQQLSDSISENRRMSAAMDHLRSELAQAQKMMTTATAAVSAASGENSAKISQLEARLRQLQAEVVTEKAENQGLQREIEALRAVIAGLEAEAQRQRQVAAEAEFDRLLEGSDETAELRRQINAANEQNESMREQLATAREEHSVMSKLKDKTLLQLNQTSEELRLSRDHFQRREQELQQQVAGLLGQQQAGAVALQHAQAAQVERDQQLARERQEADRQRQAATAAAASTSARQNDAAAADRRKADLLAKLQARTREDKATAEVIFTRAATAYDRLLTQLREAFSENAEHGQEEVYYDMLWEYERRLFHMENDIKSMKTVMEMRMADMEQEMQRRHEADETRLTILRMQIVDLGKQPNC